ncbi:MAG: D-aminoacyl-tRNA deacylase [Balneolaceae bacterium]
MKVVIQRVKRASVKINESLSGSINKGVCLFVGIHDSDTRDDVEWCCQKISKLRIFNDKDEKMNLSVRDVEGGILVISQFTLYGDVKKGTRPSFIEAAKPDVAEPLYNYMLEYLDKINKLPVESGEFGAIMEIDLINDGPVTLVVER